MSVGMFLGMKPMMCIKTSVGCSLTCHQDQKEIVRFDPNNKSNQASGKNILGAQFNALNLFQSCFSLLLEQPFPKGKLGREAVRLGSAEIPSNCTQTTSQAITSLHRRKTSTTSSAFCSSLWSQKFKLRKKDMCKGNSQQAQGVGLVKLTNNGKRSHKWCQGLSLCPSSPKHSRIVLGHENL